MKKLVKESLVNNWDLAGKLYPTTEEELESSSFLPITYAAQVIEHLNKITQESSRTLEKMCLKYEYLIEKGYEDDDDPENVAQDIWDLWLNDN